MRLCGGISACGTRCVYEKIDRIISVELLGKLAVAGLIFLNVVAAGLHFAYHGQIVKLPPWPLQNFFIVTNIMFGFSFLYIALGTMLGADGQRRACVIFNLVWWATNAIIVLWFPPDITTLSLLKDYIPLPFNDMTCITLYFIGQICLSIFILYVSNHTDKED